MLRKRLSRALVLAQISDGEEAFEEVDMDEFIFDEVGAQSVVSIAVKSVRRWTACAVTLTAPLNSSCSMKVGSCH